MAIRWVSNPESIKANQPSVLAIAETLAAMGVSVWIAVTWDTYVHIAIGASIAPLLLMRTDESVDRCNRSVAMFARSLEWFLNTLIGKNEIVILIAVILFGAPFIVWFFGHLLVSRLLAWVVTLFRHPLAAVAAVPDNWRHSAVVLDSQHSCDILPATGEGLKEDHPFLKLRTMPGFFRDLHKEMVSSDPEWIERVALWIPVAIVAFPIVAPAYAYRWSLKSTALIWSPLLWALRSVRGAGKPLRKYFSIYLGDPITGIVLWVSIAAIIGLAAKIALFNEWAGFVDWWNATPLRQVLSLYVTPAEIQWWQVAIVINSAIAIIMYIFARRWLVRIEHDVLTDEALPRRLFQIGLFIRPILSCYTIACTLYITIRATSDWELPALGTRPFPWM